MERRDFFSEIVAEAAKRSKWVRWLVEPKQLAWNSEKLARLLASDLRLTQKNQPLLQTGEALTIAGAPFGGPLSDLRLLEVPDVQGDPDRIHLLILCAHARDGISIVEWSEGVHVISSWQNLRLSLNSEIESEDSSEIRGVLGVRKILSVDGMRVRFEEPEGTEIEVNLHAMSWIRKPQVSTSSDEHAESRGTEIPSKSFVYAVSENGRFCAVGSNDFDRARLYIFDATREIPDELSTACEPIDPGYLEKTPKSFR